MNEVPVWLHCFQHLLVVYVRESQGGREDWCVLKKKKIITNLILCRYKGLNYGTASIFTKMFIFVPISHVKSSKLCSIVINYRFSVVLCLSSYFHWAL